MSAEVMEKVIAAIEAASKAKTAREKYIFINVVAKTLVSYADDFFKCSKTVPKSGPVEMAQPGTEKIITGTIDVSGIKRCYIEGAVAKAKCPNCGAEMTHDFGDVYLMYPVVGGVDEFSFVCAECKDNERPYEFSCPVTVKSVVATLEYDLGKLVEE